MKDARSFVCESGNPVEVEVDDVRIAAFGICHPDTRDHLEIKKGIITAILAAHAFA